MPNLKPVIYLTVKAILLTLIAFYLIVSAARGNELPDAPVAKVSSHAEHSEFNPNKPVFKPRMTTGDKLSLFGVAGAQVADYALTAHGIGTKAYSKTGTLVGVWSERDYWLVGRYPSASRLALTGSAEFAIMALVITKGTHSRSKAVRWLSRTAVAGDITGHAWGASTWITHSTL